MGESKTPPRTVKVVDRRKFTAEGEPREDVAGTTDRPAPSPPAAPPREAAPPEPPPSAAPPREVKAAGATSPGGAAKQPAPGTDFARDPGARPAAGSSPAQTSQDFLELVSMLAQNAEILLVGAEDLPARPGEARKVIDWLAALERKTAGNLSSDEQRFLSDLVFQLRTAYLQSAR